MKPLYKSSPSSRAHKAPKDPFAQHVKPKTGPQPKHLAAIGALSVGALLAARQFFSAAQGAPPKPKIAALPKPTATPQKIVVPDLNAIPDWTRGRDFHHGYTKEKVIALTFDDGPFPRYTHQVLEILEKNEIRATFFMIGSMVKAYPKIAREVRDAGHVIGNHSWSHPSRPKDPVGQVHNTDVILRSTVGEISPIFRPPYGIMKNGMAAAAEKEKQSVIIWSSAGSDWSKKSTANSIYTQVMRYIHPGGIILLHDGGGNRSATVRALPDIIAKLRSEGYRFVTVPELLSMSKKPAEKPKIAKNKGKTKAATTSKTSATKPTASKAVPKL